MHNSSSCDDFDENQCYDPYDDFFGNSFPFMLDPFSDTPVNIDINETINNTQNSSETIINIQNNLETINNEQNSSEAIINIQNHLETINNTQNNPTNEEDTRNLDDSNMMDINNDEINNNQILLGNSSHFDANQANNSTGTEDSGKTELFQDYASKKKALELKNEYYKVFIRRKRFQKKYVYQIHKSILTNYLGLRKLTREEGRTVSLYFNNFAYFKDEIIQCLLEHKDEILRNILNDYEYEKI